MTENEAMVIAKLAEDSELTLSATCEKRDQKERRTQMKQMLYDGSKKLKHSIPKGKKI